MRIAWLTKVAALTNALATDRHLDGHSLAEVRDALEWLGAPTTVGKLAFVLSTRGVEFNAADFANDAYGSFANAVRQAFAGHQAARREAKSDLLDQDTEASLLSTELPSVQTVMAHIIVEREQGLPPHDADIPPRP